MAIHYENPCTRYFTESKRGTGIMACAAFFFWTASSCSHSIPTNMPFPSWEIPSRQQVCLLVLLSGIYIKTTLWFHRIGTVIAFTPIIKPPSLPNARKIAYIDNAKLPGPDMHPDIWEPLPSVQLPGRIFRMRSVNSRLTVGLVSLLHYDKAPLIII